MILLCRRNFVVALGVIAIAAICFFFESGTSAAARIAELEGEVSALRLQLQERNGLIATVPKPLPHVPIANSPDETAALHEQIARLSAKIADFEREASARNTPTTAPRTKQERLANLGQIRHALAEQAQVYREARAELNRIAAPFNVHLSNIDASILSKKTFTPLDQDPVFKRALGELLAEKRISEAGRLKYVDERRQILQMP